jgi:hypothetical protein
MLDARTQHLAECPFDLVGEALTAPVNEEQADHREQQFDGVAADAADECCDLIERVIGHLAQLQAERVRVLLGTLGDVTQLLTDPRQPGDRRWQLHAAGEQLLYRVVGVHNLQPQYDREPGERHDDRQRHGRGHEQRSQQTALVACAQQPLVRRPADEP